MNAKNRTFLVAASAIFLSGVASGPVLAEDMKAQGAVPQYPYYLVIPGISFQPKDSRTTVSYSSGGCISIQGNSDPEVVTQLLLPANTTVKRMRLFYNRDNTDQKSQALFTKFDPSTAIASFVSNVSAVRTDLDSDISDEMNELIDPYTYGYQISWRGAPASNNKLCGVRIVYYSPPAGSYTPLTPCRLIDTRTTNPPNLSPVPRNFQISGQCGVPTGATAVTANVTTDQTTASTAMAIYPSGTSWPGNSSLNWSTGQIVSNSAILTLGADGMVSAFIGVGSAALILDITGYFY